MYSMAKSLHWPSEGLTTYDVRARLQRLPAGTVYNDLHLSSNHLMSVPFLIDIQQLQQLTVLELYRNNISRVDPSTLPQTLQIVALWENNLTECGDWSCIHSLRELYLSSNKIKSVDGKNFPQGLKILYLYKNNIDNIENLDNLNNIKTLDLKGNDIRVVKSLPSNVTEVSLCSNPLIELHPGCFASETMYKAFTKGIYGSITKSQIRSLQSPPPSVFLAGLQAIQQYFELATLTDDTQCEYDQKEVEKLAKTCATKVLFVGKSRAGKSSLVHTLKNNNKTSVKEDDCTVVADHHNWTPEELITEDGFTTLIFSDIGGHPSYENTVYFFCANESSNIIVVAHRITDTDYVVCYRWLKNMVFKCYKCDFIFAVTQIDLVKTQKGLEKKLIAFKEAMCEYLRQDIDKLQTLILAEKKRNKNKGNFVNVMKTMIKVKQVMECSNPTNQSVFLLCCKRFSRSTVVQENDQTSVFRKRILQLCQETSDKIPAIFCDFYKIIGTHGLKYDHQILGTNLESGDLSKAEGLDNTTTEISGNAKEDSKHSEPKDEMMHIQDDEYNLKERDADTNREISNTNCKQAIEDAEYGKASHIGCADTYMGRAMIVQQTINESENTRISVNLNIPKVQYITLDDAKSTFTNLLSGYKHNRRHTIEDCLKKLHSLGLIIWHDFNKETGKIIFNHLPSFADMIRSLFNHSFEDKSKLKWNRLSVSEKAIFEREDKYERDFNNLFSNGKLTVQMLTLFLQRYNFSDNLGNIAELLCCLNVCYKIDTQLNMFFPWYLDSTLNSDAGMAIDWIVKHEKFGFSRILQVEGYITRTLFYFMYVAIFKHLKLDSVRVQIQHIWKGGFFVHLGNVALAVIYREDTSMFVIVKSNAKTYKSVSNMWKLLEIISDQVDKVTDGEFPASVARKGLLCPIHFQESTFIMDIAKPDNNSWFQSFKKLLVASSDPECVPSTCGIFEDQIQATCFESRQIQADCGCEGDSVMFFPPTNPGTDVTKERQEEYLQRLRTALSKYPTQKAGKFTFADDCVIDLKSSMTEDQNRKTTNNTNRRIHEPGLFATLADSTYTEEQTTYIWQKLAPSVCRIVMPGQGGTGFLIGAIVNPHTGLPHRLVLTCYHVDVQGAFSNSQHCVCEFGVRDYNPNVSICTVPVIPYLYAANPDMDYALVCLEPSKELEYYLLASGAAELGSMIATCEPKDKESLVLIGHSDVKKIDAGAYSLTRADLTNDIKEKIALAQQTGLGSNIHRLHDPKFNLYQCHMFSGSSGGPCFSIHRQLLYSIHCGGILSGPVLHVGSSSVCEFGVMVFHVIQDIQNLIQRKGPIQPGLNCPVINTNTLHQLFPTITNHDDSMDQ